MDTVVTIVPFCYIIKLGITGILKAMLGRAVTILLFYMRCKRRRQEGISKLDAALTTAKREYHNRREELQRLQDRDYMELRPETDSND
jgi:hypothetical protein